MLVRRLDSIASVDAVQDIDIVISRPLVFTRSQQAPGTANGGFEGPSSGEELIAGIVTDFTALGLEFGAGWSWGPQDPVDPVAFPFKTCSWDMPKRSPASLRFVK